MTSIPRKHSTCPITRTWTSTQVIVHARSLGLIFKSDWVESVSFDPALGKYTLKDNHGTVMLTLYQSANGDLVLRAPGDTS